MGGAYSVAEVLRMGAIGLVVLLAAALIVSGTLIGRERRRGFLLWCLGLYGAGWMLFLLYDTALLVRYFFRLRY